MISTFPLRLNVMFKLRGSTSGPDKTDFILQRLVVQIVHGVFYIVFLNTAVVTEIVIV